MLVCIIAARCGGSAPTFVGCTPLPSIMQATSTHESDGRLVMSCPEPPRLFITLPWMRKGLSFSRASMIHEAYSHERAQSMDSVPFNIARREASAALRHSGQLVA